MRYVFGVISLLVTVLCAKHAVPDHWPWLVGAIFFALFAHNLEKHFGRD